MSESSGRVMPTDFAIALRQGNGADTVDYPTGDRRQLMRGFEDTYVDIVDYIVRITHRIWEDQDVGYIYDTYSPGCRLHTDSGLQYGVEALVEGTLHSINAFPDMRHYADDVIWAGNDEQGFVTSHRAINTGHHTGPWRWGPPTGRKLDTWVIANCLVQENEIVEEWVLYNTAAKLAGLGLDVVEAARTFGNEGGLAPLSERDLTEVDRLVGGRKPMPYPAAPEGVDFDIEHMVRSLWHNVFNRRDLSAIDRAYGPAVLWNGTTNRVGRGRGDVRAFARSLLSTFPDLGVAVDEVYWMGNDADGYRVMVRWVGAGTHRGYALYGKPTGRRAHIWGISQLYVKDRQIVEEWNLFNEFDVLAQLLRDDETSLIP
ncbi:ester cyclase [Gordonia sp. CPCC 205515]|uniref:ester cyclase n=1 Tax=Gordonia sp. CPCC 205515 TaxID=3140791 RepID=UPI003AF3C1C2